MQDNDPIMEKEVTNRIYEVGYLVVPTLTEEEVPAVYGDMKELVATSGGLVISDEMPKMMDLAYPMSKTVKNVKSIYDTAYFGWTKFETDSEKLSELKKTLELDPRILRFLIVKTTRASTIVSKKFGQKDVRKTKTDEKEGSTEEVEINKEEIDKEIEAMVAD